MNYPQLQQTVKFISRRFTTPNKTEKMMNSSTSISLNDRFSIINSVTPSPKNQERARPVSASALVRGSAKSKQLITMLDKKHQLMSMAKKLKNVSLPFNLIFKKVLSKFYKIH